MVQQHLAFNVDKDYVNLLICLLCWCFRDKALCLLWDKLGESVYFTNKDEFSSVAQSCWLFVTPWTAALQGSLSITNSWSLLKLMSIEPVRILKHKEANPLAQILSHIRKKYISILIVSKFGFTIPCNCLQMEVDLEQICKLNWKILL